jgi:hypothetical protein
MSNLLRQITVITEIAAQMSSNKRREEDKHEKKGFGDSF